MARTESDEAIAAGPRIAEVLVPVAVGQCYSYLVAEGTDLAEGDFVEVSLGSKPTRGVVWELRPATSGAGNLKRVAARVALPPIGAATRAFIDFVAHWTLAPRGMVLRMAARAPLAVGPEPPRRGVRLVGPMPARLTPARKRVLELAAAGAVLSKADLAEAARCSQSVIDALVSEGTFEIASLPPTPPPSDPIVATPPAGLEPDQAEAAQELAQAVAACAFSVTLLEGVTGAGKTETYFEAIAAALSAGRQALVLLPEIALTAQFLDRFEARFQSRPAEWHSGLTPRQRARTWSAVATGEIKAVIGARSALFLPFADLALVVVDEEHDAAYKQDDGVGYHARDMAVMRGRFCDAAVVLVSATPSIETRVNARRGRYRHLVLPTRVKGKALPRLETIDLRVAAPPRGRWIAPKLAAAVAAALAQREQALLFLNRRGYAPLTLCGTCGHRFQCRDCTAWLVEHRFRKALVCHFCGHVEPRPDHCPCCDAVGSLVACGPGIERIAEEASALFPSARILVLSSDFPGGAQRLRDELGSIARGACDIVIGTQLVAKGHNFPLLSLVGVIDADIGLASGDPRAAERTFQLLRQVTGRAGRFETSGRALIQTWQPEHPVMRALVSGDSERFYEEETEQRRRGGLPPFTRLAAVIVTGREQAGTEAHARALARAAYGLPAGDAWSLAPAGGLPSERDITLLGPAEAPIAVIRGRHRYRLLVRAPRSADLQGFLRALLAAGPPERGGLRVEVDIDPQSFL
jgi:primosomal protein N' (replication factor Y)